MLLGIECCGALIVYSLQRSKVKDVSISYEFSKVKMLPSAMNYIIFDLLII